MLANAIVACATIISVGVTCYLFGFFKSLRSEFERESKVIESYRSELKETIAKLSDTHNKLIQNQSDLSTKLSAFEMKIRNK